MPSGWFWKESLTFLAPDGQANVIVSSEPLDPSIDTTRYAEAQGDLLRSEFPGYQEHEFSKTSAFGFEDGYLRRFEWTPPDGEPVTQLQIYAVRQSRGYTATATATTTRYLANEEAMLDILLSTRSSLASGGQ